LKYVIIHGDGMADWPCDELGGKTPLEAAHKPNMDLIASRGELGTGRDDSRGHAARQ
jgi:2,3-bisphosphoglycerate-independent phosphoglycerate mutase